jgi:broad specificity phosphatase PhoE
MMTTMVKQPKKNIYFARHGERFDWIDETWRETAERRFDPPLSSYGLQQADELGQYVTTLQPRITHIYTSPYLRTVQTALQVAKQLNNNVSSIDDTTKIRVEPGFGEFYISNVTWDKNNFFQPLERLTEVLPDIEYFDQDFDSNMKADYYMQVDQEARQQLRDRLRRVMQCVLDAHPNECNILIITHAAPLIEGVRAVMTIAEERQQQVVTTIEEKNSISAWNMSPIRAGVCSLTHLELIDDRWTVSKNGLISYLSQGEKNNWIFPDDLSLYPTLN